MDKLKEQYYDNIANFICKTNMGAIIKYKFSKRSFLKIFWGIVNSISIIIVIKSHSLYLLPKSKVNQFLFILATYWNYIYILEVDIFINAGLSGNVEAEINSVMQ